MSQGVKQLVKELLYTLQELTLGHLVIANTERTESDYTPILNLTMYIFIKVFCYFPSHKNLRASVRLRAYTGTQERCRLKLIVKKYRK